METTWVGSLGSQLAAAPDALDDASVGQLHLLLRQSPCEAPRGVARGVLLACRPEVPR